MSKQGKGIIDTPVKEQANIPASKGANTQGKKGIIASPNFVGENKGK